MPIELNPPGYPIIDNIEIPAREIENWQITVDLLSKIANVPAALILRVHAEEVEVFVSSHSPGNVYHHGEKAPLDSHLYCEAVMSTRRELLVPNALKDPLWDRNPDIARGMISYCGLPLTWPGGQLFGTICMLDHRENAYSRLLRDLLERFRDSLQFRLKGIYDAGKADVATKEGGDALTASEERHRTIIRTAMDGFWMLNAEGRLLEVNETYCRMTGYSAQELLTMRISDLEAVETADETATHLRELMTMGEARFESRHRRKDGVIIDVDIYVQYRPTEGGHCVAFLRDITDRKRTEKALGAANELLMLAQQSARAGVWNWDIAAGRLFWSQELFLLFGLDPASDVATLDTWRDILHPDDRQMAGSRIEESIRDHTQLFNEYRIVKPVGEVRWIQAYGNTTYDDRGEPLRMSGICIDITERKHAEEEKAKLEEQLHQAMKMETVGRLAGGVAHDFNNILTVITGYSELLLRKIGNESPIRVELGEILRASERAALLTRQLLTFSRKQVIEPKVVDLNLLTADLGRMLVRLIGENIDLKIVRGADLGLVKVDPSQFEQVLVNMAVNSRDAMPDGGTLRIETANVELDEEYCAQRPYQARPGRFVSLLVSDTGHGMSEETITRIFEPFFTTKAAGKGTGLGLSMVYGAVKQSGGSIEVYSEVGKGATFKIYLPVVESAPAKPVESGMAVGPTTGSESVLLVEDDGMVRNLCVRILEGHGYRVMQAGNSDEAISLAAGTGERIDLLLTDVVMPGMNGAELATQLVLLHPEMKVLFTSGYTDEAITRHGVLDEGVSFIGKPYDPSALARKVREVLDKV
jgi:two-component system cell cycle sensor histidine kinase/response regulator CckA